MREGKGNLKGPAMLMVCALIWGSAFVAQSKGMDYMGPCTFNAVRNFIGSIALLPVIFFASRLKGRTGEAPAEEKPAQGRKLLWGGGLLCGVFLCVGSLFQQFGIQYTSVGKAGFLTALYIVIVPVLGIFLGRKPAAKIWLSVVIALGGTYLLSVTEDFSIATGDLMVIFSAVFFSLHIMLVDRVSPHVDGVRLSCIQFFVSGVISLVLALFFEEPRVGDIAAAWIPLLYTGLLSSGVGYTLQILGQRNTNPTVAAIILSLESVFAAVAGWLLLGPEGALSAKEMAGCALVFAAVVLAQLPARRKAARAGDTAL